MPFPDPMKKETNDAFDNPLAGDRFTEMYAFYMYVLRVTGKRITYMEANPPCELPRDGKIFTTSIEEFRKKYAYGSKEGYWVRLAGRGHDVTGWIPGEIIEKEVAYDYQI